MKTYSPEEVAAEFGRTSAWWLREGVRRGKYPHLRAGKAIRFTEEHLNQIALILERPAIIPAQPLAAPADVSVFGATSRSQALHRTRKAS